METFRRLDRAPQSDAEFEAAIDLYITEMEGMTLRMEERRRRIERLRSETEAMLDELSATFTHVA
jgi:hypothetical protein